jgi:hypothetical protein
MKNILKSSTSPIIGGGGGQPAKLIAIFAIFTLSFFSLTTITFPIQQAQAATSPLCGPASGTGAEPVTATSVSYGGKLFDIIGYNKNGTEVGVAGPNNSVTLLLNKAGVHSLEEWDFLGNSYQSSNMLSVMDTFANLSLSTTEGVISRTLTGDSNNYGTGGYNEDWVAGPHVTNQKVWLLSVGEVSHLILSERVFDDRWWLRSPGTYDENVASVDLDGRVYPGGYNADHRDAVRPALYHTLNAVEGLIGNSITNSLPIGACTRELIDLGIDYSAETVTGLDTATEGWKIGPTYAGLGAFAPQASTSTDIDGVITNSVQSLVFVKASDDNDHFDSDRDRNKVAQQSLATTINIPARPARPSVVGVAPSDVGKSDGKITGTSNKMEYSTDEATWTSVTGVAITGLTSGTYFVRTIADQSTSKFKSFAKEVVVKEGSVEPSAGPGSGTEPSAGNSGTSSEGTAQTGIDFTELELLISLLLAFSVIARSLRRGNLYCSKNL